MKHSKRFETLSWLPQKKNSVPILLAILALAGGCDNTVNTCRDYYAKRINVDEAALRLRINLTKQDGPIIGDGIAWGIVSDDIDKYCHVKQQQ